MDRDERITDRRAELAARELGRPVPAAGARLRRSPEILWRSVHDGVLLLAPGGGRVTLLSGSGSMLWHLLAEPMTQDELCDELAALYRTDGATVRKAANEALSQLRAGGAVNAVEANPP